MKPINPTLIIQQRLASEMGLDKFKLIEEQVHQVVSPQMLISRESSTAFIWFAVMRNGGRSTMICLSRSSSPEMPALPSSLRSSNARSEKWRHPSPASCWLR